MRSLARRRMPVAVVSVATAALAEDDAVNIGNWSDCIDPDGLAAFTEAAADANGNIGSRPLLEAVVIDDPAICPSAETMERLFTTTAYQPGIQRG